MATLTTPTYGFPYPDGAERVMDGDNAMGALALAVENVIKGFQGPPVETIITAPLAIASPNTFAELGRVTVTPKYAGQRFIVNVNGHFTSSVAAAATLRTNIDHERWIGAQAAAGARVNCSYSFVWVAPNTNPTPIVLHGTLSVAGTITPATNGLSIMATPIG
jgi:hypothetical protein